MFDELVAKPKPRRWQTAVIVGSAVAHAAVIAGIAVAAMWEVKTLDVGETVDITFNVPPPQGQTAPPPASKLDVLKPEPPKEPPKVVPKDIVQPEDAPKDPPKVTTGTTGDTTTGTTKGPGGDGTDPDADPENKHQTCPTPGACIDDKTAKPPRDDKDDVIVVKKPDNVTPAVAKGLRYAGNDQIHPPEMVRVDMVHQGKNRLTATVQICVNERGAVDKLRVLKSSGFQPYDDKILGEMRNWKYNPYLVNGVPSPMCSVTIFDYRMTGR